MTELLTTTAIGAAVSLSPTTISEAAVPGTTTFVQQVIPSAFSTTTPFSPSTTTYTTGEQYYTGVGKRCQVSNLWNWNTIDTCFIGSRWHISSTGAFAGTCIFAVLLVLLFLFLRRATEEYNNQILRQHYWAHNSTYHPPTYEQHIASNTIKDRSVRERGVLASGNGGGSPLGPKPMPFMPNVMQQAVRATLALAQFVVGYFILLLVMSWNGWMLLCIGLGVWVGSFVFDWKTVEV